MSHPVKGPRNRHLRCDPIPLSNVATDLLYGHRQEGARLLDGVGDHAAYERGGRPAMKAAAGCAIGLVVVLLAGLSWAATTVTVGTDPTKFVMKGKIVTSDQVLDGELVIDGDAITCVAVS